MLLAFVYDLTCARPKEAVKRCWERLAKRVVMSGPNPSGKFLGCLQTWGAPTVDGEPIRTIEYDMTELVTSWISMYAELIDDSVPGSSKLIEPTDLPTDPSGGGNALGCKYGDRWEHFPDQKAWRRIHDGPRTALFTPEGTNVGHKAQSILPNRITSLTFTSWTGTLDGTSIAPEGQLNDTWTATSYCHRNATAKWAGETWFGEKGCLSCEPIVA